MTRDLHRIVLVCCGLLLLLPAFAGQIPSHIYIALGGRQFLSGPARAAVDAHLDAYLSGAQGPDICGVVMPKLNVASWFTAIGEETHYDPLKAQLVLNMLDCAQTDREKAYALGWISHYVNDIFVHELVNNYGGFYELYGSHHKLLEQLENKHVYSRYPNVVAHSTPAVPVPESATFAGFIFDAYHRTFPNNPIYQSGNEWFVENRPYFCSRYNEAASWCATAGARFLASHVDNSGKHGYEVATLPFPNMPSSTEYANLMKAIEITDIQANADHLRVTTRVNDTKLYGRFNVEWDAAAQTAIMFSNQVFTFASEYLAEKDPVKKVAKRTELLAVIPNHNLDQPKANFDAATVIPGNVDISRISYQMTLKQKTEPGKPAPGKPVLVEGVSGPITMTGKGFGGSRTGEVTFDVTVPADSAPYTFTLKVGLSGLDAMKVPEFRDVDWTQAEGTFPGTWLAGVGRVNLADTFSVRLPLPKAQQAQPKAARRWIIAPPGYTLLAEDVPLIKARLPREGFRYDVVAVEEKIENGVLEATLQVTNTSPYADQILGQQTLLMIWFADGKAEGTIAEVLEDLGNELDDAGKELEKIQAIMDEIATLFDELVTDEQEETLGEIMMKYEDELQKKGVKEEDIQPMMNRRAMEEMHKLGIDTTRLEELQAQLTPVEIGNTLPFNVGVPIHISPVNLYLNVAGGWTPTPIAPNLRYQNSRGASYERESKDEEGRLQWRVTASNTVNLIDDEETVNAIKARQTGDATTLSIAGYSGTRYQTKKITEKPYTESIIGEAILKKGKVYLQISYTIEAMGYVITERDKKTEEVVFIVVYDGKADASRQAADALSTIESMYSGTVIQLMP